MTTLSAIPGSSRMGPNPVSSPSPTQPPQMDTNAPRAINTSGQEPSRARRSVGASTASLTGADSATPSATTSDVAGSTSGGAGSVTTASAGVSAGSLSAPVEPSLAGAWSGRSISWPGSGTT